MPLDSRLPVDAPLAMVGCDFRAATSRQRAALILDAREADALAAELVHLGAAIGLATLNTCNRTEWIVASTDPRWAVELLAAEMKSRLASAGAPGVEPISRVGSAAALRVFRVALGLESLVLGERQIAGQLFDALEQARLRKRSCPELNRLGTAVGRMLKVADRSGCGGEVGRGVHSLAVSYLRTRLPGPGPHKVAVLGLGNIGRQVYGLLDSDAAFKCVPLNRTLGTCSIPGLRPLDEALEVLGEMDAAVVCTGARQTLYAAEQLPRGRNGAPLLVVDIGVPPQVAPGTSNGGAVVVGLDELAEHYQGSRGDAVAVRVSLLEGLAEMACEELVLACQAAGFATLLDFVQRRSFELVYSAIPVVLNEMLPGAARDSQRELEARLRKTLLGFSSELVEAIKAAAAS